MLSGADEHHVPCENCGAMVDVDDDPFGGGVFETSEEAATEFLHVEWVEHTPDRCRVARQRRLGANNERS